MTVKRTVLYGMVIFGILILLLLVLLVMRFRNIQNDDTFVSDRYIPRTLRIPHAQFLLPNFEKQLRVQPFEYFLDTNAPLDTELMKSLEVDPLDAIHDELLPRLTREVEELLFE